MDFGVELIVMDKYYLLVVHNDPYGWFFVIKIHYFGQVVLLMEIYAPCPIQATQNIALWTSLLPIRIYPQLSM